MSACLPLHVSSRVLFSSLGRSTNWLPIYRGMGSAEKLAHPSNLGPDVRNRVLSGCVCLSSHCFLLMTWFSFANAKRGKTDEGPTSGRLCHDADGATRGTTLERLCLLFLDERPRAVFRFFVDLFGPEAGRTTGLWPRVVALVGVFGRKGQRALLLIMFKGHLEGRNGDEDVERRYIPLAWPCDGAAITSSAERARPLLVMLGASTSSFRAELAGRQSHHIVIFGGAEAQRH